MGKRFATVEGKIYRHIRSNVIGYVALFVALSGTAVAAQQSSDDGPKASASVVTDKQFKKLKKQVNALQAQVEGVSKQPGPQGVPGPQGLPGSPGTPGQDATNLFAYIRDGVDPATVQYGTGVTTVADNPAGPTYTVTFNRSVVNCVVQAVAGTGDPPGTGGVTDSSFPLITMVAGGTDQVNLTFTNAAGNSLDTPFMITAFC